jgi:ribosome-interacting GTPase 1
MGVVERIKEIEDEMARTQKNKATEGVSIDGCIRVQRSDTKCIFLARLN